MMEDIQNQFDERGIAIDQVGVSDVALRLRNDPRVAWFRVHVVNNESIHNHSTFARVEWARVGEGPSDRGRARRVQSR